MMMLFADGRKIERFRWEIEVECEKIEMQSHFSRSERALGRNNSLARTSCGDDRESLRSDNAERKVMLISIPETRKM